MSVLSCATPSLFVLDLNIWPVCTEKPFGLHGLYNYIPALLGLMVEGVMLPRGTQMYTVCILLDNDHQ